MTASMIKFNGTLYDFEKLCTLTSKEQKTVLAELTSYANEFLQANYNMDLIIPIKLDRRSKQQLGGFYHYANTGLPIKIRLFKDMVAIAYHRNNMEGVKKILRHELIHFALYMQAKQYEDGTPLFESELATHDAPSSGSTHNNKVSEAYAGVLLPIDICGCYKDGVRISETLEAHKKVVSFDKHYYSINIGSKHYTHVTVKREGFAITPSTI